MLFAADRRPLLKSDVWLDQFQSWCIALAVLPIMETAFIMWIHRHHLSTDVVKRISSRKHVGIPRFRRDLSKNADEVAQHAWEFALAVDVAFRHCYPVLILVVFSYKLSSVDLQNFFLTESAAALAAITVMINIVLLMICFIMSVLVVVTLSRRFDLCWRRPHPAFEPDEETTVPDETSDEEGETVGEPLETPRYSGLTPAPILIEEAETKTSCVCETVDELETMCCSGSTLAPSLIEEGETKTSGAREASSAVPATTLIETTVRGSVLSATSDTPPSGGATGIVTRDDEIFLP